MSAFLKGVCCQYCIHFEKTSCPIQNASPWSRWKNWCNEYEPNPDEPEAKPFPGGCAKEVENGGH